MDKESIEVEMDEYRTEREEMEREAREYWDEHRTGRAFGISDKDFI